MKKSFGMKWNENSRFIEFDDVEFAGLAFELLDRLLSKEAAMQQSAEKASNFTLPPKCPHCGQRHTWKHMPA